MTGWIAVAAVLAIGIPFAFFGVGDFFMSSGGQSVAKVGDEEVSQREYSERFNRYREQMQRQFEGQLDGSFFDQPEIRMQVLDGLVTEQILLQAGREAGLVIPADRLRREIIQVPAFQVEGTFNPDVYVDVLGANRMTPAMFEREVSRDLEARELLTRISQTAMVTAADVNAYARLRNQTRDFTYLRLDAPALDVEFEPDQAAIEAYYEENSSRFMTPEQVELEYVELLASELDVDIDVDESELRQRYAMQLSQYGSPEQRVASHILVPIGEQGDADAHREALAKVEALREQLLEGADFAELAREHSADPGSARDGGDLGLLEPGLTDPVFDEALFSMEEPGYSEPVLTGEGFHLIWLREIREGDVRSFEEVRDELKQSFKEPERERQFIAELSRMYDLVMVDASALEPIADSMGLEVRRTGLFGRGGGPGIAGEREVIRTAFSDLVLLQGDVSDPIEIGVGRAVAIRVLEHKVSTARPLDEVRGQIVASLREQDRLRRATEKAEAVEQRWLAGESLEDLASDLELEVALAEGTTRTSAAHDGRLVREVFQLPRPDAHGEQRRLVALGAGNYALVHLTSVADGDPAALTQEQREELAETLRSNRAQMETDAFVSALRERIRVQIYEDRLE